MCDFRLLLVTDRSRARSVPLSEIVSRACRAGVRAVQLRDKHLLARPLLGVAKSLRGITADHGARLLVNDRPDIALAVGADGVHCPENGFPPSIARRILGRWALVGMSTHSVEAALRAQREGADYILFGPVYGTWSKGTGGSAQGPEAIRRIVSEVDVPVYAVGGITPERAAVCVEHGAAGVAVISAIIGSDGIECIVGRFEEVLGRL